MGGELGRGGMGVVSSAEQIALRREVAVKRVAEHGGPSAVDRLLKEAWIGAYLTHPNVVPVHALAEHEGAPAVVMKRVEGRAWRAFIGDPASIPEAQRGDPLGWHLEVVLAVCNAIELAHARGVLHLDLKPDNVMIGAFGEVYVVDWGLAAGIEGAPAWLPRSDALRSVAGTPDYMAPELAAGAAERIDRRTDVYLLGAMLHEAVTGRPPHAGDTAMQKLYRAYVAAPPSYDASVPVELARLLQRAMAKERGERFEGVRAFREAVEAVRAHRAAEALTAEAEEHLERLGGLVEGGAGEVEVWQRFGACRFALREAHAAWPEHPALARLGRSLFERMARWAIDEGRLELAESYLAELEADAGEELRAGLEARRAEREAEAARVGELEELAYQEDVTLGVRYRRSIGIALGLVFFAVNVAMGVAERLGVRPLDYGDMLVTGVATFAVFAPYAYVKRDTLFRNRANSAIFSICITTGFVIELLWLVGWSGGLPFRDVLVLTPVFYLLAFGAMTMLVSTRFFVSPLVQVPTALAVAAFPAHAYELIGIGGGLSAALVGLAYRPSEDRADG
jgi:serine/threonine-protein kinase